MTITVAVESDWVSITTALGTAAAAIAAVSIALWTDRRSDKRIAEERQVAREREQLAEAYAVQVLSAESDSRAEQRLFVVIIVNHGTYTITGIEARLRLFGGKLVSMKQDGVPAAGNLDHLLTGLDLFLTTPDETFRPEIRMSSARRLAPWDAGTRFIIDQNSIDKPLTYPIVRWIDKWGTRWEHSEGEVRRIHDDEPWPET